MDIFDFLYEPYSKPNEPKLWDTGESVPEEILRWRGRDLDPGFSKNISKLPSGVRSIHLVSPPKKLSLDGHPIRYRKLYTREGFTLY